jgi:predicted amidohydrolase YtcJ
MKDKIDGIAVGRLADFVVLGQDPLACDPERILQVPITRAVIGGDDTDLFAQALCG